MVIGSKFCVDIVTFYCEVCAFLLVVKGMHRVMYGAKGVCLSNKVLEKF